MLNQNYHAGWHTSPPRNIISHYGLIAARILPANRHLDFYYQPRSYIIGKSITWITIVLIFF